MPVVIAHIGFPKTGTTFLQKKIFSRLQGLNYLDNQDVNALLFDVIEKDDSLLDLNQMKEVLTRKSSGIKPVLLSCEALTGHHYRTAFPNRSQIARRLKAIGVQKIIITVRNQFDILESVYKQYIKSGGVLRPAEFFNFDRGGKTWLYLSYFDYHAIYKVYADIFGDDNISLLQYEDLYSGQFDLGQRLSADLDISLSNFVILADDEINRSLTPFWTKCLRLINHLTYNSHRPSHLLTKRFSTSIFYNIFQRMPFTTSSHKTNLLGQWRDKIISEYMRSNQNLQSKLGIQLHSSYFGE